MADRTQPIGPAGWTGIAAAAAIPVLILATVLALVSQAEGGRGLSAADWAAIRFTLWQAAASSLISILLAIPLARALARRQFVGRGLMVTLLGAPFLLPVIVAIFGLIAVFGRNGILNTALEAFGLPQVSIYGAHGVILAHVFFNLPLAARLILQGWSSIPSERFRLAASLGMSPGAVQRHLEWPMLQRVVPGAFLVIFVICTTSFAVALTLGGGPRATTVELAIYQALRFEFDLTRAAVLSMIQLAITGSVALVALRHLARPGFGAGLNRPIQRWDADGSTLIGIDTLAIASAALFLLTPILMVVLNGALGLFTLPEPVWRAAGRSIAVAFASTCLVVASALVMAEASTRLRGNWSIGIEASALLAIAASPVGVGTGRFILRFP
ncbi:MAG: thiamine/thiamine pyrophosphate ABC transporter permease ThiP, partial [Boseongicola sp.]|nr:thiamine/thiamine pyrophosphate ABC transporter permease ThiP [Boseongicola sp.]